MYMLQTRICDKTGVVKSTMSFERLMTAACTMYALLNRMGIPQWHIMRIKTSPIR